MTPIIKSGSLFARLLSNSGWNLLGQGAGLLVAIFAIPVLLTNLGPSAFGLLTIFLALIGYSGLLDLGIGRAVTAEVAKYTLRSDRTTISNSITTAMALVLMLATLLSTLLVSLSAPIAGLLVGVTGDLLDESRSAVLVLSLTVPVVLLASCVRGALEGLQEFKVISKVMMPTGMLMFAVPATLSIVTPSVTHMMWALFLVRLLALALLYAVCKKRIGSLRPRLPSGSEARSLLRAGGWMTVSNVVSPIMTNLDRLFISAQISPAAAALYVMPYELATKTLLPAGSIANAIFPVFAAHSKAGASTSERKRFFWRATLLTAAVALVPSLVLFVFAQDILTAWISIEFAQGVSTDILRLLAIGIVANGAAYIPFAFIQGIGRADVTAKFHLAELAIFIPTLLYALQAFGVLGAAMVWVGRAVIDTTLLFAYASRRL